MSNAAILYLRLLRKIVRESAWRLGGGEETFLAGGFGVGDGNGCTRIQNPACGGKLRAGKPGNRQTQDGKRHSKQWNRQNTDRNRHK